MLFLRPYILIVLAPTLPEVSVAAEENTSTISGTEAKPVYKPLTDHTSTGGSAVPMPVLLPNLCKALIPS